MKRNYSVKEAANLLGVSMNTMYSYLEEGKITATRIGHGRFKIPHAALAPHISPNSASPTVEIPASVTDEQVISYDHIDFVFFRLLVGFLLAGTGVIALIFRPFVMASIVTRITFIPPDVIATVSTYVPIAISLIGMLMLGTVFIPSIFLSHLKGIYVFTCIAFGYMAWVGYIAGRYDSVVLSGTFLLVTVSQLVRGVRRMNVEGSFEREFWKVICLMFIGSAFVALSSPETFPLPAVRLVLAYSRVFVGLIWFVGVIVPVWLFFFFRRSNWYDFIILPSVIVIQGCFGVLFATQAKWVIFYGTELLVTFTVFLLWWRRSGSALTKSFLPFLYLALTWAVLVLLLGIFGMNFAQKYHVTLQIDKMKFVLSEVERDMTENIDSIDRHLASAGNKKELLSILKTGNKEDVVNFARTIYDQIPNMRRIALVNKEGIALGSYPIDLRGATLNADVTTRDYFIETKRTLAPFTSTIFQSRLAVPIIVRTYPILAGDTFMGMILAIPDLTSLSTAYKTISQDVDLYSFDSSGAYTIHPDPTSIGSSVRPDIFAAKAHEVHQTIDAIHVFKTLRSPPWTLYTQISLETVLGRVTELVGFFSLLIGLNSFVTLSFMFLLLTKWKNR